MSVTRRPLDGPTVNPLAHREAIDWHDHARHQLVHPIRGVLLVSTPLGIWTVPPHRAVWIPAAVPHAHQAHGPTEFRSLAFDVPVPLPKGEGPRLDRPTVLAVSPLLHEIVIRLSSDPRPTGARRHRLERVVLDELRGVEALPLWLPTPEDDRLRAIADTLTADPADPRTLAELGAAVGAAERTLSRLFREQTGMSFPQWRNQIRLHHSLRLLASGASVTSAATHCGYHSTSAFVESFRLAFGTTPGRYQREATGHTTDG